MNFFWLCYFPQTKCFYLIAFYHLRTVSWRALRAFFCLFQDHIIQTDDINCSSQLKDKFSHMCSVEIITLNLTFVIILAFYRGIFFLLQYLIKIQFVLNLCAYSDSKTVFIGESWLLEKFNRIACLNRKKRASTVVHSK